MRTVLASPDGMRPGDVFTLPRESVREPGKRVTVLRVWPTEHVGSVASYAPLMVRDETGREFQTHLDTGVGYDVERSEES